MKPEKIWRKHKCFMENIEKRFNNIKDKDCIFYLYSGGSWPAMVCVHENELYFFVRANISNNIFEIKGKEMILAAIARYDELCKLNVHKKVIYKTLDKSFLDALFIASL